MLCLSVFAYIKLSQHEEMNLNVHDIHVNGEEMNLSMYGIHVSSLRKLARQLSCCTTPECANSSSLPSSISSTVLSSFLGFSVIRNVFQYNLDSCCEDAFPRSAL